MTNSAVAIEHLAITIPLESVRLEGDLSIPTGARGAVLFAHGSGSSRRSPRNRYVADVLNESGLATLLIDLLTEDENEVDLHHIHEADSERSALDGRLRAGRSGHSFGVVGAFGGSWILSQRQ